MLGITTKLEVGLILVVLVLGTVAGAMLWEHHKGYEACRQPEIAAQKTQKAADTSIDQGIVSESDKDKTAVTAPGGPGATPPPQLGLCKPGRVSARPPANAARPVEAPSAAGDSGLPSGAQAEAAADIGPVVQDLALAGVLVGTNGELLWKRDVEQAQKPK